MYSIEEILCSGSNQTSDLPKENTILLVLLFTLNKCQNCLFFGFMIPRSGYAIPALCSHAPLGRKCSTKYAYAKTQLLVKKMDLEESFAFSDLKTQFLSRPTASSATRVNLTKV